VIAGRVLAAGGLASAAIDLSDGLSTDLARLCAASRVGAIVDVGSVPVAGCVRRLVPPGRAAAIALAGGEDYELLIAAPPQQAKRLARLRPGGRRFLRIGEIRPLRDGLKLREPSGHLRLFRPSGFRHFSD
jgi:thiamine-monophosphate kinase